MGLLLTGIVEMDETYVGGKPRKGTKGDGDGGKHKPGRGTKKAPVIGALSRAWRQPGSRQRPLLRTR